MEDAQLLMGQGLVEWGQVLEGKAAVSLYLFLSFFLSPSLSLTLSRYLSPSLPLISPFLALSLPPSPSLSPSLMFRGRSSETWADAVMNGGLLVICGRGACRAD